jgi:hypothetical protein
MQGIEVCNGTRISFLVGENEDGSEIRSIVTVESVEPRGGEMILLHFADQAGTCYCSSDDRLPRDFDASEPTYLAPEDWRLDP